LCLGSEANEGEERETRGAGDRTKIPLHSGADSEHEKATWQTRNHRHMDMPPGVDTVAADTSMEL